MTMRHRSPELQELFEAECREVVDHAEERREHNGDADHEERVLPELTLRGPDDLAELIPAFLGVADHGAHMGVLKTTAGAAVFVLYFVRATSAVKVDEIFSQ